MKLVIFGKPQSGKGTFAELIAKDFGLEHLSAGELLREHYEKFKKYMNKGVLVPPKMIAEIIKKKVSKIDNYIFDGYPRNLEQMNLFCPKFDKAIFLNVSDETVMKRFLGRVTCSKCESIFNVNTETAPKKEGICDNCGGKLIKRGDDMGEKVIKKRLAVYNKETKPVVDIFKKKDIFVVVDANRVVDEIYADIKKILKA